MNQTLLSKRRAQSIYANLKWSLKLLTQQYWLKKEQLFFGVITLLSTLKRMMDGKPTMHGYYIFIPHSSITSSQSFKGLVKKFKIDN